MEHLEAMLDYARRADALMEEARTLLNRAGDIPLRLSFSCRSVPDDLIRAGWATEDAQEQARQLGDQVKRTLNFAAKTKTEIECMVSAVDELIGKTGRLV